MNRIFQFLNGKLATHDGQPGLFTVEQQGDGEHLKFVFKDPSTSGVPNQDRSRLGDSGFVDLTRDHTAYLNAAIQLGFSPKAADEAYYQNDPTDLLDFRGAMRLMQFLSEKPELRGDMQFRSYAEEGEHQMGASYWSTFDNVDELLEDFNLYKEIAQS